MSNHNQNTEIYGLTGVGYYNIDNKDNKNKKENKEKIYRNEVTSFPDKDNICLSGESGLASLSLGSHLSGEAGVDSSPTEIAQSALNESMISRAVVQLFDNGTRSKQRYKLKIRFNLVDKENPEFIAAISQDMRNFKKYIPAECYDDIVELARELRIKIKNNYDQYPLIGKFHFNNGWNKQAQQAYIQIEPWTFAGVWFDTHHNGWDCLVKIYDWHANLSLSSEYINDAQRKQGIIAQTLWSNPKYQSVQRPLTWAEQRRLAK